MYLVKDADLVACSVDKTDRVLVACSGGADSVALLLECVRLLSEGKLAAVFAAHLHHGIRGAEADQDAEFCRALCRRLDVPLYCETADVPTLAKNRRESLETVAREVRYAFLQSVQTECRATVVALGHHRGDQAETVLLHLLRGSGINGLCGMRLRNGVYARPLLNVSKAEILSYLAERNEPYCTDSTNDETEATRNRIRKELIPMLLSFNPSAERTLCKTAQHLRTDADHLDSEGVRAAREVGNDRYAIAELPDALRLRVLRTFLPYESFDTNDLATLDTLLTKQAGTTVCLKNGVRAWVDSKHIFVGTLEECAYHVAMEREGETVFPKGRLRTQTVDAAVFPHGREIAFLDAAFVCGSLTVRSPKAGDRFTPYGMNGSKLVSDYLSDRGIGRYDRNVPLICDEEGILVVVGHTVDHRVRIRKETKTILSIQYQEEETNVGQGVYGAEH